jgi:hypothetical protein
MMHVVDDMMVCLGRGPCKLPEIRPVGLFPLKEKIDLNWV